MCYSTDSVRGPIGEPLTSVCCVCVLFNGIGPSIYPSIRQQKNIKDLPRLTSGPLSSITPKCTLVLLRGGYIYCPWFNDYNFCILINATNYYPN